MRSLSMAPQADGNCDSRARNETVYPKICLSKGITDTVAGSSFTRFAVPKLYQNATSVYLARIIHCLSKTVCERECPVLFLCAHGLHSTRRECGSTEILRQMIA